MSNPYIDRAGDKYWRNAKMEPHREDGPAIEYANGTKVWMINGLEHREDGPAVEYGDGGDNDWYVNGKLIK